MANSIPLRLPDLTPIQELIDHAGELAPVTGRPVQEIENCLAKLSGIDFPFKQFVRGFVPDTPLLSLYKGRPVSVLSVNTSLAYALQSIHVPFSEFDTAFDVPRCLQMLEARLGYRYPWGDLTRSQCGRQWNFHLDRLMIESLLSGGSLRYIAACASSLMSAALHRAAFLTGRVEFDSIHVSHLEEVDGTAFISLSVDPADETGLDESLLLLMEFIRDFAIPEIPVIEEMSAVEFPSMARERMLKRNASEYVSSYLCNVLNKHQITDE